MNHMNKFSDEYLVCKYLATGDSIYMKMLLENHKPDVEIRICSVLLKCELDRDTFKHMLDDCFQEICRVAIAEIRKLKEPSKFGPWIGRIAQNTTSTHIKYWIIRSDRETSSDWQSKQNADLTRPVIEILDPSPDSLEQLVENELYELIYQFIEKLPERLGETLRLYINMDCPKYREIAEKIGTTEGTIQQYMREIRIALKNFLERQGWC